VLYSNEDMRFLKRDPFVNIANDMVVDYPSPANISYLWNFGSLAGLFLGVQLVTGIILAMHYTPHMDLAFNSIEHIMRDVNYGWFLRYCHANGASFFFLMLYAHILRGLYYGSYIYPRALVWHIGVAIYLLTMVPGVYLGLGSDVVLGSDRDNKFGFSCPFNREFFNGMDLGWLFSWKPNFESFI